MGRTWKNICVGQLLLVVLVIILHSTISHHHHFDRTAAETCSLPSEKYANTHESNDNHCHILNDAAAERQLSLSELIVAPDFCFIFNSSDKLISETEEPTGESIFAPFLINIAEQYTSGNHLFRGPPAV